nr:reverse transcriptase [Tanacetum cinerariifolium]
MALESSDPDAEYALSRLLQRGTVAEYQNEFEMLISRVTGKSDSLLTTIYIFGLKSALQRALLWSNPTTLGEAFSLARVAEARFANQGPTTTKVSHEVAQEIPSEALRETTTTADTVAKIKETYEFYTSESEEHGTKLKKEKSNDEGFKWGVQEASTFEELKHRHEAVGRTHSYTWLAGSVDCNAKKIMRSWNKECFSNDTLRGMWFRRSEECYALSL